MCTNSLTSEKSPKMRIRRKRKVVPTPPVDLPQLDEVYEKYSFKLSNSFDLERPQVVLKAPEVAPKMCVNLQPKLKSKKVVQNHLSLDRSSVLDMTDKYEQSQVLRKEPKDHASPVKHLEKYVSNEQLKSAQKQGFGKPKPSVKFDLQVTERSDKEVGLQLNIYELGSKSEARNRS